MLTAAGADSTTARPGGWVGECDRGLLSQSKAAIISALSMKFSEDRIVILKEFPLEEIKTRKFKDVVDRFGLHKVLFVLDKPNQALEKSSRNLSDVKMIKSEGINVYDLLKHDHVVLLEPSVRMIEGALLA